MGDLDNAKELANEINTAALNSTGSGSGRRDPVLLALAMLIGEIQKLSVQLDWIERRELERRNG